MGDHGQAAGHGLGDDHAEGLARVVGVGQDRDPVEEGGDLRVGLHRVEEGHVPGQPAGVDEFHGLGDTADDQVAEVGQVPDEVGQEIERQPRPLAGIGPGDASGHGQREVALGSGVGGEEVGVHRVVQDRVASGFGLDPRGPGEPFQAEVRDEQGPVDDLGRRAGVMPPEDVGLDHHRHPGAPERGEQGRFGPARPVHVHDVRPDPVERGQEVGPDVGGDAERPDLSGPRAVLLAVHGHREAGRVQVGDQQLQHFFRAAEAEGVGHVEHAHRGIRHGGKVTQPAVIVNDPGPGRERETGPEGPVC